MTACPPPTLPPPPPAHRHSDELSGAVQASAGVSHSGRRAGFHALRRLAAAAYLSTPSSRLVAYALLVGWVLTLVSLPVLLALFGDGVLPGVVTVGVLLQAAAVAACLISFNGGRETLRLVVTVGAMAWALEAVGVATGYPFGAYYYTERMTPHVGGVPWTIPFSWLMMLPPAWAVADRLVGGGRGWKFVAASAVAFTAWDLFLDPQMVAWGFWVWREPDGYFGIPWSNFAGWLAGSAVITAVARPGRLPTDVLLVVYGATWFLEWFGQIFFWGWIGPGLVGMVTMGAMLFLAATVDDRRTQSETHLAMESSDTP
ncbi:MAG: carotenoid biosynthesis protein [Planctomycetia bacterium]